MRYFYHYTHERLVEKIKQTGVFSNHPYFTTTEYYTANGAGQSLGVMPGNINCVLKFRDDGRFKSVGIVDNSNRFAGGGNQYQHPGRPKPIAKRKIGHKNWEPI